jgi:hypothetical protein
MSEKRKNTQQETIVRMIFKGLMFGGLIFLRGLIFWGLVIFAILGFIGVVSQMNAYEQQRLADLLQVSTYDDIPEMILTQYPIESSTHDDFDALFSSLPITYNCNFRQIRSECPKNQCRGNYTCTIGHGYRLEIEFTQRGEVTDYRLGTWGEPDWIQSRVWVR